MNLKTYKIIDDSGVDYNFMSAFGFEKSWVGQIVRGWLNPLRSDITIEKPFGIPGTYTASAKAFEEITEN